MSVFELVEILTLEVFLQSVHLVEQSLDLSIHLVPNSLVLNLVGTVKLLDVDVVQQNLALFKTGANLVGQPSGDRGATSSAGVLGVVDDVLLDHDPVLVAEVERGVDVAEHQEAGVGVSHTELLQSGVDVALTVLVNVLLVVEGAVLSQREKILGQLITGVIKTEGVVDGRDDGVLGTGLTSELELFFADSLVEKATREDIIITLNSHDEGSEVEIVLGVAFVPHRAHAFVHVFHDFQVVAHALIAHFSVAFGCACEHFVGGLDLPICHRNNSDMHKNKTSLVGAPVECAYKRNVVLKFGASGWHYISVLVVQDVGVRVVHELPVVQSVSVSVLKKRLTVSDTVSNFLHGYRKLFRDMFGADAVLLLFDIVVVARFVHVSSREE